jgi:hypothetical protein
MGAVVLGWDPDQGSRWTSSYEQCVRRCRDEHRVLERSPVGTWQLVPVGTRVHLMVQGRQRGLVGRGTVRSAPFLAADPTRPGQVIHHVLVEWDTLLPLTRRIPVEALQAAVPTLPWGSSYATTLELPSEAAQQLDLIWATHASPAARRSTCNPWRLLRR